MNKTIFHPKVSIVIPVYNGSNYLKEAIDSALSQTYDNVEVIVVNDGSNDNGKTDKICKSYGDKIRYFVKENGGVATALNKGIEEMKGEYFSWLSHDDVYYPNKIEEQIKYLETLDTKSRGKTIIYSNYELIDANSGLIAVGNFEAVHQLEKLNSSYYPILNGLIHGCSLLIPLKCFSEVGRFDPTLKTTQDYALWFTMFPKFKVHFEAKVLIKSRYHEEQGSKKITVAQTEAEDLWLYFMKELKDEDKIFIGGSLISFYKNTLKIVKDAGYTRVVNYLKDILEQFSTRNIEEIKVSVIIPFFNRQDFVIESIKSVLKQTHKNYEIILVNDSSDEDISKLLRFVKSKKKIKLTENKYKKGPSGARNTGIDLAKGEYVAFLDSDDLFLPDKIVNQLEYMVTGNHIFSSSYYETFEENHTVKRMTKIKDLVYPEVITMCNVATPTIMLHSDVFKDKRIRFNENLNIGEDVCLWIDIARISPCKCYKEILTKVRLHGENAAYDNVKQVGGLVNIFQYVTHRHLNSVTSSTIVNLGISMLNIMNNSYSDGVVEDYIGRCKYEIEEVSAEKFSFVRKFKRMLELFKSQGVFLTLKKFSLKVWKKIVSKGTKSE